MHRHRRSGLIRVQRLDPPTKQRRRQPVGDDHIRAVRVGVDPSDLTARHPLAPKDQTPNPLAGPWATRTHPGNGPAVEPRLGAIPIQLFWMGADQIDAAPYGFELLSVRRGRFPPNPSIR